MSEVLDSFGINFVYVLATVLLIGINGGSLGTFALLRKRSLLGDALAHARFARYCFGLHHNRQ
jgi:manganese/zinc/iron transport system permease protein